MLVLLLAGTALAAPSRSTTRPYPGVTYTHEIRENPPLHLHIVTIDLANPRIHLRVRPAGPAPKAGAPWTTTLLTPSVVAERDGLDVAVNGDFFVSKERIPILGREVPYFPYNPAHPCGLAITDGKIWNPAVNGWYALLLDDHNRLSIEQVNLAPAHIVQAVGGQDRIVHLGKNTAKDDPKPAPRTAVGFDRNRTKLVLLVVDGRRESYSVGLGTAALGDEMIRLGCDEAMNLDGGGSSTLVIRDPVTQKPQVMNHPSDGHDLRIPLSVERPVAMVLGFTIDKPTTQPSSRPAR
jgi:hypothetical protein